MISPIQFIPIYQERIWGGRELENVYARSLPTSSSPYGESWEISDREEAQSVVRSGSYQSRTLSELWSHHRDEIFGENLVGDRFPLLVKILDARDDLSIQVHPPEEIANELGGEPKTEMWYIAKADEEAKLYVGLKNGADKNSFQAALETGTVEEQVHAISPESGDSIFIPSGRLHAIGAGFLIYEIQQNSDTTYRVYDWERKSLDGKARELHIDQSMRCIDFSDHEPSMDEPTGPRSTCISDCEHFYIEKLNLSEGASLGNPQPDRFSIVTVVKGTITDINGSQYSAGDFLILPRNAEPLTASSEATILQTIIPY